MIRMSEPIVHPTRDEVAAAALDVSAIVRRKRPRLSREEAVSIAGMAAVVAASKYDPARGDYRSAVLWWVRAELSAHDADNRPLGFRRWANRDLAPKGQPLPDDLPGQVCDDGERLDISQSRDSLPDRQRAAILALYWHGLTTREAGDRLGVSRQTIANDERAALATLRDDLGSYR